MRRLESELAESRARAEQLERDGEAQSLQVPMWGFGYTFTDYNFKKKSMLKTT